MAGEDLPEEVAGDASILADEHDRVPVEEWQHTHALRALHAAAVDGAPAVRISVMSSRTTIHALP